LIELPRDAEILADHRALVMEQGVVRLPEQRSTTIKASGAMATPPSPGRSLTSRASRDA